MSLNFLTVSRVYRWSTVLRFSFRKMAREACRTSVLLACYCIVSLQASAQTTHVVENLNDSGAGSLRAAILAAVSGDTITFTNSLSGETITLTKGQLSVTNNLTIDASALSGGLTIDGNGSSRHFVFEEDTTNVLNHLMLANGYRGDSGGAIFLNAGCLLTLYNSTLSSNTAIWGGAIYINQGTLTLNHCTLADNYAYPVPAQFAGSGGAIFNGNGTLTLNNSALVGNSASLDGGSIFNYQGSLTLNHATLAGNSATYYGGGIYVSAVATLNATNSIVAANSAPTGSNLYNLGTLHTNANNLLDGAPLFVDADAGNYRLQTNSPCIDAAIALAWITDDIEGTPRPLNGDGIGAALPDIGAYEHISLLHSTDGDAHTDYEEYIADTDPTDSNHWFRLTEFSAGMPATVSFDPASARRQYSLFYSTNLVDGIWAAVSGQVDVVGSGGTGSLAHSNSLPTVFYQIRVGLADP